MADVLHIEGILRIYEFPADAAYEELACWWGCFDLCEKMRQVERLGGRLAIEARNLTTSAGRTQILSFIGASGSTNAFAQYYAVGTGTIYVVQAADTSLASELFRAVPSTVSVIGNSVTISTPFSTSQANGTYTNAGIFGNNATSTPNSGTLMTHLLYSYTKTSANSITNDYAITLT